MSDLRLHDKRVNVRLVYAPGDRWRLTADFPYEGAYRERALAIIDALFRAEDEQTVSRPSSLEPAVGAD